MMIIHAANEEGKVGKKRAGAERGQVKEGLTLRVRQMETALFVVFAFFFVVAFIAAPFVLLE